MYEIEQKVWVKSEKLVATVQERGWMPTAQGRRAFYIVEWTTDRPMGGAVHSLLTGSDNLRAADWCCDGCGRWLAGQPHRTAPDGEYPNAMWFCFLCSAEQIHDNLVHY